MMSLVGFCCLVLLFSTGVLATTSAHVRSRARADVKTPVYAQYTTRYTLSLPYVSISVPSQASADVNRQVLVISNFGSTYSTLYRYDKNQTYIQYVADETPSCMQFPDNGNVATISPLPTNLNDFTFVGLGPCPDPANSVKSNPQLHSEVQAYRAQVLRRTVLGHGRGAVPECAVWELDVQYGPVPAKFATAQFFADPDSGSPVQLSIFGHNNITQSHFDTYIFDYSSFTPSYDGSVFNPPNPCPGGAPPGLVAAERRAKTVKPIEDHLRTAKSFILQGAARVGHMFSDFMIKHSKQYSTIHEHAERRAIFARNLHKIESHNADDSKTYKLKINHFADMTPHEYRTKRSSCKTDADLDLLKARTMPREMLASLVKDGDSIPDYVNWIDQGAVWPPKDQGWCGSCWTFGAVGALEGFNFLKTGNLVSLSEQNIVDCDWVNVGGCGGGDHVLAWEWLIANNTGNIATDKSYPYTVTDGYCLPNSATQVGAHFNNYYVVPTGDENALMAAVAKYGPAAIAIDASHDTFGFYSHGVYYESACGNTINDLDHVVLLVGYGTDPEGGPYWLVKNSWSEYWGNEGYVRMSRKDNNCGVATEAGVITN